MIQAFGDTVRATTGALTKRMGKTPVLTTKTGDTAEDQRHKGLTGANQSKDLHDLTTQDEVARAFARAFTRDDAWAQ